jgi:hypothetical protein
VNVLAPGLAPHPISLACCECVPAHILEVECFKLAAPVALQARERELSTPSGPMPLAALEQSNFELSQYQTYESKLPATDLTRPRRSLSEC